MSDSQPTHTRRVFKYGTQEFPDPGAEHTPQQVLDHLKAYFPELGNGRIDEKHLDDGTLEITFSKQVTTKGCLPAQRICPRCKKLLRWCRCQF